ncbi:hypothetical protein [Curtobacterium sp. MCBD17_040]|uniref:hypothetical protein n=1 Tax=Curtobacterium sp. MCBD17_040 TaxID=2175674 RepID=UPI0011B7F025|nr:hypothetical protein [Curtobacterium sp. MCBD17_040]WIB65936.1 hypothetical protein DEI94_17635 [Curtobacterium sp. MCBD17_040]
MSSQASFGSRVGAFALIVGILGAIVATFAAAVFGISVAISGAAHKAAGPTNGPYGECDGRPPWPCEAVPERTIEARFGRTIHAGSSVLTAEAQPTADIVGHPQVQVVFELPAGVSAGDWLSLLDTQDAGAVADPDQVPELGDLGVTGISGGRTGGLSIYAGEVNGRTYVWAYREL